jgi:hypothetical protein
MLAHKHLLAHARSTAFSPLHSLAGRRGLMSPAQSTGQSAMVQQTTQERSNGLLLPETLKEAMCFSLLGKHA